MNNIVLKVTSGIFTLSFIMVIIFYALGYGNYTVITGAMLGATFCSINFIWLKRSLEKSISHPSAIRTGYLLRMGVIAAMIFLAIKLPYFNMFAAIIPLFFTRIVITLVATADRRCKK